MKKIIVAAALASFVALGLSTTVNADTNTTPQRGYITVSTNAETEIIPDTVEINFTIKTKDSKFLQKAATENKLISEKICSALKAKINTQNGDYIKTTDYNARPIYVYDKNNKKSFDKYQVTNSIIVRTKNIENVGSMIDDAISLGATDVNDLKFSVSDYESKCNELLAKASKKAKTRADITTKESGTYVTGVKSMRISCSENTPNKVVYRMAAKMVMDSAANGVEEQSSTPIQSGTIKIYASVSAEYFVK